MSNINDIFIISDTHFLDPNKKIFKNSIEDSNKARKIWNSVVSPDNLVIIIGDFIYTSGEGEKISEFIQSLNGNKFLIIGNHDNKTLSWYLNHGISFVSSQLILEYNKKKILFLHNPIEATKYCKQNKFDFIIHGHLHGHKQFISKDKRAKYINVCAKNLNFIPKKLVKIF